MVIKFKGEIFYWRGPAPFFFIAIPQNESDQIKAVSSLVTYGWGVIPVRVQIGETNFKTSLFPKEDRYLVPVKAVVRKTEILSEGDSVEAELELSI
jgi:hypothetical protein